MEIQVGLPLFEKRLVCSTILRPIRQHSVDDACHLADCPRLDDFSGLHIVSSPPPFLNLINGGCRLLSLARETIDGRL